MAAADRFTGSDLKVFWRDAANGTTELTADQRSFTVTRQQETADVTAGADEYRTFKATVKVFDATLEILMSTSGTAVLNVIDIGTEGTLFWAPEGTADGNQKWAFPAIVTSQDQTLNFDDAAAVSVSFQSQGSILYNGGTATWSGGTVD